MVHQEKPRTVYWLDDNLYLNITNKCSNHCIFCLRNFKQGVAGFNLKLKDDPTTATIIAELQEAFSRRRWKEIVFCGFGEPTARLDCLIEIARWIRQHYSKSIAIRVNTNGHGNMLNRGRNVARELKAAGVNKVSVSLNAGDEETYNEVCKPQFAGAYAAVLDFIRNAKGELEVEVTAVTTPEVDLHRVRETAEALNVNFRLRECIPCFW
ncbi:MAG: TatD family nuclease-associated radical SAM protein [Candidatus Bathyarchaeia archaeon]